MRVKKLIIDIKHLKDEGFYCGHEVVNGKRINWEAFQVDFEPGDTKAWVWVRLND